MNPVARYTHWLHTQWPAGRPEKLPRAREDFSTNVPGLFIVGDLTGAPLLKLSANAGTQVVRRIASDPAFGKRTRRAGVVDLAIIGGGTAGFAAALEADRLGLDYLVLEAAEPFATIANFPKAKPIYTYPTDLPLEGDLRFGDKSSVKEGLLEDLREQTVGRGLRWTRAKVDHVQRAGGLLEAVVPDGENIHAHRVIVAIGRSGNHRKLDVPGEDLPTVYNRLHDPADFAGQCVLVVGGGDSALETAIALTQAGADVTLSYRGRAFSRAKAENVEKVRALAERAAPGSRIESAAPALVASAADSIRDSGARADDLDIEKPTDARESTAVGPWTHDRAPRGALTLLLGSRVEAIRDDTVDLRLDDGAVQTLPSDSVFTMLGREAPLDFFRRSGVTIVGERTLTWWFTLAAFLLLCVWMYHWKKIGVTIAPFPPFTWIADLGGWWYRQRWFPYNVPAWWSSLGEAFNDPAHLLGTLKVSLGEPGFYYSLLYCACVVGFGVDRIRRRRTPYVTWQTITLATIQVIPLFLLPYALLPWIGHNGAFDNGAGAWIADQFFPRANYGHGREYWRAFGLILAWPLFIWNVFTAQPLWGWLVLSFVQTFVLIPAMIYFWGKGAYCGWICSCGALAETMGDRHRWKMPHGPGWNRLNMLGQAFLAFALLLFTFRAVGWAMGPRSWPSRTFSYLFDDIPLINYVWFVDLFWAGILGVGLYFWFSGRVWCRFACPLAAWMHIVHRFSRFRILADKKKCISCNVCTSVCHQGIDIMSFANKGEPMADPQCVRCSACVQMCPTGVLSFGQVDRRGEVIREDPAWLAASPVRIVELKINGRSTPLPQTIESYRSRPRTPGPGPGSPVP